MKTEEITDADLLSLDGKDLVCFCAPQACHGDVLLKAIEYVKNKTQSPPVGMKP